LQVLKAAERAKNLVKQILAFSRKNTSEPKPVQLHLVAGEALNLLRSTIPTTIDIKADIASANDIVIADATQLHQIIMNLCANAAHAMRQNGGVLAVTLNAIDVDALSVSAYADIAPGPYVQLSVRDNGTGIPGDIVGRIFEPFFTTKAVGEGTGMGLAVVHGIVKSLKGDIKVYSEPGRGTVFHVLLPQLQEKGSDVDQAARIAPLGHERVHDEPALLDVGMRILASLGYQVTATKSATEALELFKHDPAAFDLVITDQTMPELTGYELAQQLMNLRNDIPVILCTGYSDLVTADSALAGGIRAFVLKPLDRLSIAETIRTVLGERAKAPGPM
jgi:two-component system cell cycle sensor histidine kinase/response regulator CckA